MAHITAQMRAHAEALAEGLGIDRATLTPKQLDRVAMVLTSLVDVAVVCAVVRAEKEREAAETEKKASARKRRA